MIKLTPSKFKSTLIHKNPFPNKFLKKKKILFRRRKRLNLVKC